MRPGARPKCCGYVCPGPGKVSSLVTDPLGTPVTPAIYAKRNIAEVLHLLRCYTHKGRLSPDKDEWCLDIFWCQVQLDRKCLASRPFCTNGFMQKACKAVSRALFKAAQPDTGRFLERHTLQWPCGGSWLSRSPFPHSRKHTPETTTKKK